MYIYVDKTHATTDETYREGLMRFSDLHGILDGFEVRHDGAKQQVADLGEGEEDDKEHNHEAAQVLLGLRDGVGELCHCLVKADVLKELKSSKCHNSQNESQVIKRVTIHKASHKL